MKDSRFIGLTRLFEDSETNLKIFSSCISSVRKSRHSHSGNILEILIVLLIASNIGQLRVTEIGCLVEVIVWLIRRDRPLRDGTFVSPRSPTVAIILPITYHNRP